MYDSSTNDGRDVYSGGDGHDYLSSISDRMR